MLTFLPKLRLLRLDEACLCDCRSLLPGLFFAAGFDCILATIGSEAQGINMQHDADAIVCRPTPGDVLEQMKGRVDRPGQTQTELTLVVVFAQGTIEEALYAAQGSRRQQLN